MGRYGVILNLFRDQCLCKSMECFSICFLVMVYIVRILNSSLLAAVFASDPDCGGALALFVGVRGLGSLMGRLQSLTGYYSPVWPASL